MSWPLRWTVPGAHPSLSQLQQVRRHAHASCRVVEPGETWGCKLTTLVGDAAHPTTPALGQGGRMALEVRCCDMLMSCIHMVTQQH